MNDRIKIRVNFVEKLSQQLAMVLSTFLKAMKQLYKKLQLYKAQFQLLLMLVKNHFNSTFPVCKQTTNFNAAYA